MKIDLTEAEITTIEKLADVALKSGGLQNMGIVHAFWTGFVRAVQRGRAEAQAQAEMAKAPPKLTAVPSLPTPKEPSAPA